jgi:hypothetical protein
LKELCCFGVSSTVWDIVQRLMLPPASGKRIAVANTIEPPLMVLLRSLGVLRMQPRMLFRTKWLFDTRHLPRLQFQSNPPNIALTQSDYREVGEHNLRNLARLRTCEGCLVEIDISAPAVPPKASAAILLLILRLQALSNMPTQAAQPRQPLLTLPENYC